MTEAPPPPVLDSARVLSYVLVHDIPYRLSGALIVDGKPLEHVPRLAICVNLGEDIGPLLLHCDIEWNVLGCAGGNSVSALKEQAERNYPGALLRWVDVNTSIEDALRYYDAHSETLKCSFCGKRPFELERWAEGDNAVICRECVSKYHAILSEPEGGDSASG